MAIVLALALLSAAAHASSAPRGRGMWIWYLDRSAGGDVAAIAAEARAQGVDSVEVKAADGTHRWSQFSSGLVARLHAAGLGVCAWQYVYGSDPVGEARAGISAVRDGADCLIIDAEGEYDGRYAAAQAYLSTLRAAVGAHYPLALASFPYVDYHPAFPYSVFLGPGGAQFDMPQMYWNDIGSSVRAVYHHTYAYNRIYGRPIIPLGQSDGTVSAAGVQQFRGFAVAHGAPGISWWDFAWTSANSLWPAIGAPISAAPAPVSEGYPTLTVGTKGDAVVLLQEHLASLDAGQQVTGLFGAQTRRNLVSLQRARRLSASGATDRATWQAVLGLPRSAVRWGAGGTAARSGAPGRGVVAAGEAPASAGLADVRQEIPELGSERVAVGSGRVDPG